MTFNQISERYTHLNFCFTSDYIPPTHYYEYLDTLCALLVLNFIFTPSSLPSITSFLSPLYPPIKTNKEISEVNICTYLKLKSAFKCPLVIELSIKLPPHILKTENRYFLTVKIKEFVGEETSPFYYH